MGTGWKNNRCPQCGGELKKHFTNLPRYRCSNCNLDFIEYFMLQDESGWAYRVSLDIILEEILRRTGYDLENLIVMEVGAGTFPWWFIANALSINSDIVICLDRNRKVSETRKLTKEFLANEDFRNYVDKIEFIIADARHPPLRNVFDIIYCHRFVSSEINISKAKQIKDVITGLISLLRPKTSKRSAGQLILMEYFNKPRNKEERNFLDWWGLKNRISKMLLERPWPILSMKDLQSLVGNFKHKKYVVDFCIELKEDKVSTEELYKKIKEVEYDCQKYGIKNLEKLGIKVQMLDKIKNNLRHLDTEIKEFGVQLPPYSIIVLTK
jgi:hypothetical protein